MAIIVNHPVLGEVSFPDDYTMEQIDAELLEIGAFALEEKSSGEVFFNQMGEGLESTVEGIGQMLGITDYTQADYADEFRNRVEIAQNPVAGLGGYIVGSILDPVTLPAAFFKPIVVGGKLATGLTRGAVAGAAGGVVEPVYEEFGDDRAFNTAMGTIFGGALGTALNRIVASDVAAKTTKLDTDEAVEEALDDVANAVDTTPTARVTEEEAPDPFQTAYDEMIDELDDDVRQALPDKPRVRVTQTDEGTKMELVAPEQPQAVLPRELAGAKPRFQKTELSFNNDIEKSLYIIGKSTTKSARHDDYVSFVKQATGLDEGSIQALARQVHKDIIQDVRAQGISKGAQGERPAVITPTMSRSLRPVLERPPQILSTRTVAPQPAPVKAPPKPRIRVKAKTQEQSTPITDALEGVQGSVGAMQTSRVQRRTDLDLSPAELGRLRSEGFGAPRTRAERRSGRFETDPETGEQVYIPSVTPRRVPDAVPEYDFPEGPIRNFFAKVVQSTAKTRRVANQVRGRVDTRGKGTKLARTNAATRLAKNLRDQGKSISDYLAEAKRISPTDVYVYGRLVKPQIDEMMADATRVYDDLLEVYGSADDIPKKVFEDLIGEYMNAILLHMKMSGRETEASDILNAKRFLLDDFKKDDKIKRLLGVRCL